MTVIRTNSYSILGALALSISFILLFTQCNPKTSVAVIATQSPDYGAGKLDAQCLIFHRKPDSSDLYFKIDVLELIPESKVFAREELNLNTCIKWKKASFRDSICQEFQLQSLNGKGSVLGVMPFPLTEGNWEILVEITDVKSRKKDIIRLNSDKLPVANHAHDYLLINSTLGVPFFSNEIVRGDTVQILHSSGKSNDLRLEYCSREFKLPPPPFSDNLSDVLAVSDLEEVIISASHNNSIEFIAQEGYYRATKESETGMGNSWVTTQSGLHSLTDINELAASLRYITTKSEYDLILKGPEIKKSVDNYWLECAGSMERARELIALYYSRVEYSNRYFSSFTEGWRTDRGLIYIIYGPPRETYEDEQYVRWYYEETGEDGVVFNFKKTLLPKVGWIYLLERSPNLKTSWENRVQQWRRGTVYGKV
jgi:GWxTD domain-containing protein